MELLGALGFGPLARAFPLDTRIFRLQSAGLEQYLDGRARHYFFHLELLRHPRPIIIFGLDVRHSLFHSLLRLLQNAQELSHEPQHPLR